MGDELDKPPARRAQSHWDDRQRSSGGRRGRTAPMGVDTAAIPPHVDPELTPPPAPPPSEEDFRSLTIHEQVAELHATTTRNAAGVAQVWGARHDERRLDRMENRLDDAIPMLERAYATLDHWVPELQKVMATTATQWDLHSRAQAKATTFYETEWPRTTKLLEGLTKTLDDIVGRLGRVEQGQQDMTRNFGSMSAELRGVQQQVLGLDTRVTSLEMARRDEANIAKGSELAIERGKRWAAAGISTIKVLAGAAVPVVAWLIHHYA